MPVDAARPAVEFSLSVPGAFGSVWALWSAADVAISLATSVHIMDSPLVQLAALGTASAMGALSFAVHYDTKPTSAPSADLELGLTCCKAQQHEDGVGSRPEQQHAPAAPDSSQSCCEGVAPMAAAGRSPSMVFREPDEPVGSLKL